MTIVPARPTHSLFVPLDRARLAWVAVIALGLCAVSACSENGANAGDGNDDDAGTDDDGASDVGGGSTDDGGSTGDGDGDGDGDGGSTGDGDGDATFCADLGLPVASLQTSGGDGWGDVAAPFVFDTTFGPFDLAERWTGCDSYVFIIDRGDQASAGLAGSAGPDLFSRSALNVHYFFLTAAGDPEAGADAWQQNIAAALQQVPDAARRDHFVDRVHFVTEAPSNVPGLGSFLAANDPVWVLGIDRAQTWDDPGSWQDVTNTFVPSMPVLGYTSRYYNFRHAQDLELAAQSQVTEVPLMDNVTFAPDCVVGETCFDQQNGPFSNSNNHQVWTADFPDANTMAGFDTLELVVEASCGPDNYADCGHWDYEAFVKLCDDAACTNEIAEVARWITPYARPGTRKWVFELSPLLGLLRQGGAQHFRFSMLWNMNPNTWNMTFRLRDAGKAVGSAEVVSAWQSNRAFNDTYNDGFSEVSFTPPASTTKVELVSIISGHGQATGNCAEWCEHQHEFTVNGGASYVREFVGDVQPQRCAEMVDQGVVPGQFGNWTPGRAGWCPGLPVQPWVVDITGDVTVGQPNTLNYRGLYNDAVVTGDRGRIRMSTYVVFSQ